jgi:AcrR family transcriptional regulator
LQKGLPLTSVNQIARTAELSIGTVYFYFKNKEDIFASLQAEGLDILHREILAASRPTDTPAQKLARVAATYLDFSVTHKNYFEVIHYFLSAIDVVFSPTVKQQIDQHGQRILLVVETVIEEGIATGAFRPLSARRYALIFWGMIHGLIPFRKMRSTLLKDDHHQSLFESAVDNFIAGIQGAPVDPRGS